MVCDLELGGQVKKEITVLNFSLSDWGKNLHTGRIEKSGRKKKKPNCGMKRN